MPLPRRLPPTQAERFGTVVDNLMPGALRGRSRMLAPQGAPRGASTQRGGATVKAGSGLFWADNFTATAGAQTLTLTYLPRLHSEHVYLNGIELHEGVEWTRGVSGRDVAVLAAAAAGAGDWIEVRYAFDSHVDIEPL